MSPVWIYRNFVEAWSFRGSLHDFLKRLRWIYERKLPAALRRDEDLITFRFPPPLNKMAFLVRSNMGSDQFIFGEVFHHCYYELNLGAPPSTVLDLGANAGFTAVYFGRCFPEARIACVEPIPDNVRLLRRNCELNGINATVLAVAVAIEDGELVMEMGSMDYGHRVVKLGQEVVTSTIKVPALSVPTIMRSLGWDRIGLLKVDIEGYEQVLFSGDCSWLGLVDTLCIECHDGFGERDLERLARDHHFRKPRRLPGIWLLENGTTQQP